MLDGRESLKAKVFLANGNQPMHQGAEHTNGFGCGLSGSDAAHPNEPFGGNTPHEVT